MKKITLALLVLLTALTSNSQNVVPRGTPTNTVQDYRLDVKYNLYIPKYIDTTTANLATTSNNRGIDSAGAIILTYSGGNNKFWVRKVSPKRWVEVIDGDNISNYIINGGGGGNLISLTLSQLRASSTSNNVVYYTNDLGGGTWLDKGPNNGVYTDDGVKRILSNNGHYLERQIDGIFYDLSWFGDLTTNFADALRSAIQIIPKNGAILNIPTGKYTQGNGSSTDVNFIFSGFKNLTINGNGSTITANSTLPPIVNASGFVLVNDTNVVISNLSYDGRLDARTALGGDASGVNRQHGFGIYGACDNIILKNITSTRTMMDGFYVGGDGWYATGTPKNIRLENVTSTYNYRQGLSAVGVDGLYAHGKFSYTGVVKGTAPTAGIDLEAFSSGGYYNKNVIIGEGSDIGFNAGSGLVFENGTMNSTANKIRVHDNQGPGVVSYNSENNVISNSLIENNSIFSGSEKIEISLRGIGNKAINNTINTNGTSAIVAPSTPLTNKDRVIDGNIITNLSTSTSVGSGGIYVESTVGNDIVRNNRQKDGVVVLSDIGVLYVNSPNAIVKDNELLNTLVGNNSFAYRITTPATVNGNNYTGYNNITNATSPGVLYSDGSKVLFNDLYNRQLIGNFNPEGRVAAGINSVFTRSDSLYTYVKKTIGGSTGWVINVTDLQSALLAGSTSGGLNADFTRAVSNVYSNGDYNVQLTSTDATHNPVLKFVKTGVDAISLQYDGSKLGYRNSDNSTSQFWSEKDVTAAQFQAFKNNFLDNGTGLAGIGANLRYNSGWKYDNISAYGGVGLAMEINPFSGFAWYKAVNGANPASVVPLHFIDLSGNMTVYGKATINGTAAISPATLDNEAVTLNQLNTAVSGISAGAHVAISLASLRSSNTSTGATYELTDYGGGTFLDKGVNSSSYTDNTGTRILSANGHYLDRQIADSTLNAVWFGVTGNGSTDDAIKIQSVLDIGGVIKFSKPLTNYLVGNTLIIHSNTHIIGLNKPIFKVKNATNKILFNIVDATNVFIDGITIDGNIANQDKSGTDPLNLPEFWSGINMLNSTNVTITNNIIKNCNGDGITIEGRYTTTAKSNTNKNITIRDNEIYHTGRNGISVIHGDGFVITGNTIHDNKAYTSTLGSGIDVEPNVGNGSEVWVARNGTISDNTIYDNNEGINLAGSSVTSNQIFENIKISSNSVYSNKARNIFLFSLDNTKFITSGIIISDNNLKGDSVLTNSVFFNSCHSNIIFNHNDLSNSITPILLYRSSDASVTNNNIQNYGGSGGGSALELFGSSNCIVTNNTIKDGNTSSSFLYGISLTSADATFNCADNNIENNRIVKTGTGKYIFAGLVAVSNDPSWDVVKRNKIDGNTFDGITAANVLFVNTKVSANQVGVNYTQGRALVGDNALNTLTSYDFVSDRAVETTDLLVSNNTIGTRVFDNTKKQPIWWNGIKWVTGLIDGYNYGAKEVKKVLTSTFPDAVANQKVDVLLPSSYFLGDIDISIQSGFLGNNAAGVILKKFSVGYNPGGTIYSNDSRYTEAIGGIVDNFSISNLVWDASLSKYKITINHLTPIINPITVKLSVSSIDTGSTRIIYDSTILSSVYVGSASVADAQIEYKVPIRGVNGKQPTDLSTKFQLDSLAAAGVTEFDPNSISKADLSTRVIADANAVTSNGFYYSASTNHPSVTIDGALLNYQYNTGYQVQMFGDWRTGGWYTRGKAGGAFGSWRRFMTEDMFTDSINTRLNSNSFKLRIPNALGVHMGFVSTDTTLTIKNLLLEGPNVTQVTNDDSLVRYKIAPRIATNSTATTITPDFNSDDGVKVLALASNLTVANPTGTAVGFQRLTFRFKDNGTARTITWGTKYRGIGVTLPTTTVAGKILYVEFIYNADDSGGILDGVRVNQEL